MHRRPRLCTPHHVLLGTVPFIFRDLCSVATPSVPAQPSPNRIAPGIRPERPQQSISGPTGAVSTAFPLPLRDPPRWRRPRSRCRCPQEDPSVITVHGVAFGGAADTVALTIGGVPCQSPALRTTTTYVCGGVTGVGAANAVVITVNGEPSLTNATVSFAAPCLVVNGLECAGHGTCEWVCGPFLRWASGRSSEGRRRGSRPTVWRSRDGGGRLADGSGQLVGVLMYTSKRSAWREDRCDLFPTKICSPQKI